MQLFSSALQCDKRDALFAYNVLMQWCLDITPALLLIIIKFLIRWDTTNRRTRTKKLQHKKFINNCTIICKPMCACLHPIWTDENSRNQMKCPVVGVLLWENLGQSSRKWCRHATNNLHYADDSVLLDKNMQNLRNILNNVITASRQHGLTLNVKKPKYMIRTTIEVVCRKRKAGKNRVAWLFRGHYC